MKNESDIVAMAAAARAAIVDPVQVSIVGEDANPRFELFHADGSLCSQKVRTTLNEKKLPYRSNTMSIMCVVVDGEIVPAEHYSPAYVRLRLLAGRELSRSFVSGYTGSTSVEGEGFDPCVVPLLVDYDAGRVIADSARICRYLNAVSNEPIRLMPEDAGARDEVVRQMSIVDRLPNGPLLYGFHPEVDHRPVFIKEMMRTAHANKIVVLEKLIEKNEGDAELVSAYRAKIVKESGGRAVNEDGDYQRAKRQHVKDLLSALEVDLGLASGPYLAGEVFTLADVLWGVNLLRIACLGLASMWDDLPRVAIYVDALARRPSLREEVIKRSAMLINPAEQSLPDYFAA
jgi:glutathione S-transferase